MTIGEVIKMLMEIYNTLIAIFGDLFKKEEGEAETTEPEA